VNEDEVKRLTEAIAAAQAETRQHVDTSLDKLRQENAAANDETRRHFDVSAEAFRHEVQLVAESVAHLDAKLDVKFSGLEEKIERTAKETQAMFKFSHAELDRRVTTLEETVAELQMRVERLESSTH